VLRKDKVNRPIKSVRPIILALDDRFHPPSQLGSINNPGSEGAAQISAQVFGSGEKRLFRRIQDRQVQDKKNEEKNAVQGCVEEEARARPPIDR